MHRLGFITGNALWEKKKKGIQMLPCTKKKKPNNYGQLIKAQVSQV